MSIRPLPPLRTRLPQPPSPPKSAIAQHLRYFDGNGDGKLQAAETREGLQRLGMSPSLSWVGAALAHAVLGPQSARRLTLEIELANAARTVNPDGAGFLDEEGRFKRGEFDQAFQTADQDRSEALSWKELTALIDRRTTNPLRRLQKRVEFGLLLRLASDAKTAAGEPALSRSRLIRFYEGGLLEDVARARAAAK